MAARPREAQERRYPETFSDSTLCTWPRKMSSTRGHRMNKAEVLGRKIESVYSEALRCPFPYEDCGKLERIAPKSWEGFIPDLDLYFSYVAGYSSGAAHLHKEKPRDLTRIRRSLTTSFFEDQPKYRVFEKHITRSNTPELYRKLQVTEAVRRKLLDLLDLIRARPHPEKHARKRTRSTGHRKGPSPKVAG